MAGFFETGNSRHWLLVAVRDEQSFLGPFLGGRVRSAEGIPGAFPELVFSAWSWTLLPDMSLDEETKWCLCFPKYLGTFTFHLIVSCTQRALVVIAIVGALSLRDMNRHSVITVQVQRLFPFLCCSPPPAPSPHALLFPSLPSVSFHVL